jgi:4-amino-4-deoxy-L-arabinose transferase-like glycosyltransferase
MREAVGELIGTAPETAAPARARTRPLVTAAILLAMLVAAGAIFALPLGVRPLYNQDEARFALLAREALDHGRWVLPRVRDAVYLNKPPLYFWTVAAVSAPAGQVTDATAPIVSVLAALVAMLGVFEIGRRLWGPTTGLLAAAILATVPFFFFMSHQVLSDMMVAAWLTWALHFFLVAMERDDRRPWVAFYLCLAGGIAAKGPAALMVLAAALVTAAVDDGWRGVKRLRLPMGLGVLALSALPWLPPYLLQPERDYVQSVVLGHYVDWYFRSNDSRLLQIAANVGRFGVWALFLIPAVGWWRRHPDRARRQLLVWTAVVAVAVSLSGEQRARYFLPVFPLLSLLVAEFLARGPEAWPRGRRITMAIVVALGALGLAAPVVLVVARRPRTLDAAVFLPVGAELVIALAAAAVGIGAALLALARAGNGLKAGACLAGALGVLFAVEAYGYPARYAREYALRDFAGRAAVALLPAVPIIAYPDANMAYDFYLGRRVREITRVQVEGLVRRPPTMAVLIREDHWQTFAPGAHPAWRALVRGTIAGRTMLLMGGDPT